MPMTRTESFLENLGDGDAKKGLEKLKADLGNSIGTFRGKVDY